MKKITYIILFLLLAKVSFCKSYLVHNEGEFKNIGKIVSPGDSIIIAKGTYEPWSVIITTVGTVNHPIIIQAETIGKVIFTGDAKQPIFRLSGRYTILNGITFKSCNVLRVDKSTGMLVELHNAEYCRLTECVFSQNVAKEQYIPLVSVSGKGIYNRIDHCIFIGNADNQELQVRIAKDACPKYTLIDYNIFMDKNKVRWQGVNGGECLQIGQDNVLLGAFKAHTIVRENRFIRCKGEAEVISNKSSNNKYVKNYFEDCVGELVMRGGNDCIIDSNVIKGGNCGIRVNGTGHQITNNSINDVKIAIRLMYGMTSGKKGIGFYIAASNCLIKNNHIENVRTGILIGDSKDADWTGKFDLKRYPSRLIQDIAPINNTIVDNIFVKTLTNMVKQ